MNHFSRTRKGDNMKYVFAILFLITLASFNDSGWGETDDGGWGGESSVIID